MTRLPTPRRSRWQPLRIGLVDLFHYDVEEFRFRDGRLLLRGNNGTGKSKVLALTLPFLLDGDLSPRRVEPDGDPGKRMEWNLLLGGEHPHTERLGYTWTEFGRLDDATGEQHFRTLLCGLKAVSGRGIARHWYAVTRQRVDHDTTERTEESFRLLDATGTALSRDRLAEAVAGHGMVYDQAKTYRRAVDEALFGLGEQRYAALVDLLIQLRQPQLSKRPNEAALSRALTEALPPVDQAVIADVAEAFRSLDEEKDELAAASAAERAASAFLEHYRRYARIATRRRARLPRTEHSRYERVQRDLAEDQERRTRAEEKRAAAEEEISSLAETGERLRAQEAALREAPEMRDARELEHAAQAVTRTGQAANRAREDQQQADALYTKALGRLGTADNRLRAARGRAEETCAHVREQAAAAHVALPHGRPAARARIAAGRRGSHGPRPAGARPHRGPPRSLRAGHRRAPPGVGPSRRGGDRPRAGRRDARRGGGERGAGGPGPPGRRTRTRPRLEGAVLRRRDGPPGRTPGVDPPPRRPLPGAGLGHPGAHRPLGGPRRPGGRSRPRDHGPGGAHRRGT